MSKTNYTTQSHIKIMEYLEQHDDRLVRVGDIDEYLKSQGLSVNASTIYRYLNQLSKEDKLMKYPAPKGDMSSFQYIGNEKHHCDEHIHLQCVRCGRIIHLECDFMEELTGHIMKHHGFQLQCKSSVLYGICKECRALENYSLR